ncbi:MAG: sensor histidine kinase [Bacteroidota bacterium]
MNKAQAKHQMDSLNRYSWKLREIDAQRSYIEAQKAFQMAKDYNDPVEMAYSLVTIGVYHKYKKDFFESIDTFRLSLKVRKSIGDSLMISSSYNHLGVVYAAQRTYRKALLYYDSSSMYLNPQITSHQKRLSKIYNGKGTCLKYLGNYADSEAFYTDALQLKEQFRDSIGIAKTYLNLAGLYQRSDSLKKAEKLYDQSLEIFRRHGKNRYIADVLLNKGAIEITRGNPQKALEYYEECQSIYQEFHFEHQLDALQNNLGLIYRLQNKPQKAKRLLQQSFDRRTELGDKEGAQESLLNIALITQDENAKTNNRLKNTIILILLLLTLAIATLFWFGQRARKLQFQKVLAERDAQIKQEQVESLIKEKEVEALSSMIEGEEKERERISRDLHDRLGTLLSVTIMQFKTIEDHLTAQFIKKEAVGKVNEMLHEACEEVRRIAHNMSSGFLTKFGLKPALHKLVQTINDTDRIHANLIVHGIDDRFKTHFEIDIYRVIQELTSNALRHAKAKELELQLIKNDKILNIMIEDNGQGFDKEQLQLKDGMGLKNVDARIKRLNGNCNIDSAVGRGTIVSIDIPI